MTGMWIASTTCLKYSITAGPGTVSVAPKKGGMIITIAAPMSWAARLRAAATRALKWLVVTITGSRPATLSRSVRAIASRSASVSENCSE